MTAAPTPTPSECSSSSTTAPLTEGSARSIASRAPGRTWTVVHTPIHASWLNQCEIYFSIVQRKALQPNDFADLETLEQALLAFGRRYQQIAKPFEWRFTRRNLDQVLTRLEDHHRAAHAHAA